MRGVRLGMSPAELRAFVDSQPRMYADAADSLNGVTRVTLHEERSDSKRARPSDAGAASSPWDAAARVTTPAASASSPRPWRSWTTRQYPSPCATNGPWTRLPRTRA